MRLGFKASKPRLLSLGVIGATAIAHVAVISFCRHPANPSNVFQFTAAVLAIGLCLRQAFHSSDLFFRGAWMQLGSAFGIWAMAQGYFVSSLLWLHREPIFPSAADFLWLLFAFPILMVTVTRRSGAKWDLVDWLDTAQACTFFLILYVLVFSRPAVLTVAMAYNVQSVALLLACALRYSSTRPGPERVFFRNVGGYLVLYAIFSAVGTRLQNNGSTLGSWVDLCWSLPFLLFCALVLLTGDTEVMEPQREQHLKIGLPKHLHGLSALGLSVMSIVAAGALRTHRPVTGLLALTLAFLLFAARTMVRESQLHVAHDTLRHSALHDTLTGLANRAHLLDKLALSLGRPALPRSGLGLLLINLDRFKTINDGLGHPFANRLLIEVAALLQSFVGHDDLVVRLGGDEFVVLMEATDEDRARGLADKLVERFRQPVTLEGRVLHVTLSVGVILSGPGMAPDDLLRNADCAMYEAKKRGKNQAQTFELGMVQKADDELSLETDLRVAIDAGAICFYYQPIYSLSQQTIVGFEALARWKHATRGMVSPGVFIPIAEETGLVLELGKQVLREACRQIQKWNQAYGRSFTVSVNVSARQFGDPDLLQNIEDILTETELPSSLLKLEITESVLLTGSSVVEDVLSKARALGIEISLDDFGTGYSSLSYLLRFPFDVVKIDRSFVRALDKDPKRAQLVQTVVQLANNLDKKVIVEGVETEGELAELQSMQCDLIQGYLFSEPLSPMIIEDSLEAESYTVSSRTQVGGRAIWARAHEAREAVSAFRSPGKLNTRPLLLPSNVDGPVPTAMAAAIPQVAAMLPG